MFSFDLRSENQKKKNVEKERKMKISISVHRHLSGGKPKLRLRLRLRLCPGEGAQTPCDRLTVLWSKQQTESKGGASSLRRAEHCFNLWFHFLASYELVNYCYSCCVSPLPLPAVSICVYGSYSR